LRIAEPGYLASSGTRAAGRNPGEGSPVTTSAADGLPMPTFEAVIEGAEIRCRIGTDRLLPAPVWCLSLPLPARVVSGGTLIRDLAGYAEVQLPDVAPGEPREVVLAFADPAARPLNRAWLPLGGYLRLEDDRTLPLPALPAGVALGAAPRVPAPEGLPLVPQPSLWRPLGGNLRVVGFALPADEALAAVAALAERAGLGPFAAPGGVPLRLEAEAALGPEAYALEIAEAGVTLRASGRAGRFHGGVTLLALMAATGGALPLGRIEDAPRFGWRGLHLDCARHAYAPATLRRVLDLMALLKLNRLHWHLSDDEGFRLEVACAPDLAARAAFRGEGCAVPGVSGGGARSGGSYARADVAGIVAHAGALGIGVMPGIELPTHAHALVAALPGLRDPEDRGAETSPQGYPRSVVNPAMGAAWDLLPPLLGEVAGMFPLGIAHLGGRDLPEAAWAGSPAVASLMAARGLAGPRDVQGWMLGRLAAHLAGLGVRAAAWDDAGLGPDALVFALGQEAGIAAARRGHDVVMAPARPLRLDAPHRADADDWGLGEAVALEDLADWRVVPAGAEDAAARIVGVEGAFWSAATTQDAQMEPLLAPRILGLAAKAWEAEGTTSGPRLRALAGAWGPILDRMGWRRNRWA